MAQVRNIKQGSSSEVQGGLMENWHMGCAMMYSEKVASRGNFQSSILSILEGVTGLQRSLLLTPTEHPIKGYGEKIRIPKFSYCWA